MFNKLKQFKDLRDQAKQLQEELGKVQLTSSAAGGKVQITMDGNLVILNISIDPEMLSPDKKEKLESALKEAHADVLKSIQRQMAMKMKEMGGLPNIPGLS